MTRRWKAGYHAVQTETLSPQYYRILSLVCGYRRESWSKRLMLHVAVYVDETYTDDDYVVMGGYVATVNDWLNIIEPWQAILDEHPKVPYFSNHGFKSENWAIKHGVVDRRLLGDKTVKLAQIITESGILFAAQTRMWKSHFESSILRRLKAIRQPKYKLLRDPYYFAYVRLLSLLLQQLPTVNAELEEECRLSPLDVFVDENGELGKSASELFFDLKRISGEERQQLMGTAAPLDDKITIPLQCADLYVGQQREWYQNGNCTKAMRVLIGHTSPPFSDVILDWSEDRLEQFARRLDGLPENHWLKEEVAVPLESGIAAVRIDHRLGRGRACR